MESGWSADEVVELKELRLEPVKTSRGKLVALVRHFKGPKPSVWAVTDGAKKDSVSRSLATKIRDLTREGKLDWLLQDRGLTGSGGDSGTVLEGSDSVWALQMEHSGHWPDLRKAAATLDDQLSAPVQQLLALSNLDAWNESLVIDCAGGETNVSLKLEEDPRFRGLKEHFPGHKVWRLLEEWKGKVELIHGQLPALRRWVIDYVEESGSTDLCTERFAPTIVSNVVEDVYFGRSVSDFYRTSLENEYEISRDGSLWLVRWKRVGVQYLIGTSGKQEEVEALKRRHIELREELRDAPALQVVVDDYRQLIQIRDALSRELDQFAHMAGFPRDKRCRLCDG